ncbi:MAG: macro domain-containing protein [Capsulimonadaceae bacterium]
MRVNNTTIEVVRGSVTDQEVAAIVNAANTSMRGGGGIDGVIHRAGGPEMMRELMEVAPKGAPTGSVVVTKGHRLKQRFVFHTPGPRWRDGRRGEPDLLASCYRESLLTADENEIDSIGFCSIATGVYGFPLHLAAPLAVGTIVDYLHSHPATSLRRIVLAMYEEYEYEAFASAVAEAERSLEE